MQQQQTFEKPKFGATTLSITTLSIMTFRKQQIKDDTRHNDTHHNGSVVMLSVIYSECHFCQMSQKALYVLMS